MMNIFYLNLTYLINQVGLLDILNKLKRMTDFNLSPPRIVFFLSNDHLNKTDEINKKRKLFYNAKLKDIQANYTKVSFS